MYGTVAKMRMKPGAEPRLQEQMQQFETLNVPGFVSSTVYRMDADASEVYLAVVFDSRETYQANAQSPEQDARYREMRDLLEGDPEWHDGEIVYRG
jgi:quinol monooxygenase YgiN